MPLARLVKDVEVTFGATLLSSEFMSQFYTVFFTLSPESEKRFGDIEKQKKAFHSMLNGLVELTHDGLIIDRIGELRKRHENMKISSDEFQAFCAALIVSIKWAVNQDKSEHKVELLEKTVTKLRQLETYMSSPNAEITEECKIV